MTQKTTKSVFDVIESAHAYQKVLGSVQNTETNAGYVAIATADKVLIFREPIADESITTGPNLPQVYVRVNVIGVGYGVIRQVRFDSNNRAIYDIVLDEPIVTAIDQSRDWVARREELEEISA